MTQLTFDDGLTTDPALSPGGTFVVYASDRAGDNLDVYTHQIGGGAVRLTTFPEDDSSQPSLPTPGWLPFGPSMPGGGIYVVPTLGGEEPRLIAPDGRRPVIRPTESGSHIGLETPSTFPRSSASHSYIVAAAGGVHGKSRRVLPRDSISRLVSRRQAIAFLRNTRGITISRAC
jgi:hypothetical protein